MKYILFRAKHGNGMESTKGRVVQNLEHAASVMGTNVAQARKAYNDGTCVHGWFIDECPPDLQMTAEPWCAEPPKDRRSFKEALAITGLSKASLTLWCVQNRIRTWGGQYYLSQTNIDTIRRQHGGSSGRKDD